MIVLFLFISLFVGLNIKAVIPLGIIEALLLVIFLYFRVNKKFALISIGVIALGVGLSFIRPSFNKDQYTAVVVEVKENYYIASSTFEKFYIYEKNHNKEIGDIYTFKGSKKELDFTTLESSFDFKEYLNNKGVYSQFYVEEVNTNFSTPLRIFSIKKKFLSHFDENTSSLLASILFGYNEDSELTSSLRSYHLARLISNSGFFLNIFFVLLYFIFNTLFKNDKRATLFSIIVLLFYSLFTFPRFVVIKYIFIRILRWINEHILKKKFNYLQIVSFSGIFFLLVDYHLAYQDSFLLTYFIPLFVYFLNNSLRRYKNYQKSLIIIPLVAVLFIPFSVSYYQEISPLSMVLQIVFTPLFAIFIFFGLISFIFYPLSGLMNFFGGVIKVTGEFSSVFLFKIHALEMNPLLIFAFEIIFILFLHFSLYGFKKMWKLCLLGFVSLNGAMFIPINPLLVSFVSFVNIGQGDSTIIHYGTYTVMIDTGGLTYTDVAKESLIPYLKKNQIYDIDLLITTHDDFDHCGAVDSLMSNFKVKRYVKDYLEFPISIGNKTFTNYNIYPELWKEENDESLVIGFSLGDIDFLVMGDAPQSIEKRIIKDHPELRCDILKVGHHGSKTSTSEEFVRVVNPTTAIISCGKNNKFGHPNEEVLDVLNKKNISIRRTDIEGTIKYKFFMKY